MAKHVFEVRGWGGFTHLGELMKESDKTVTFNSKSWGHARRHKSHGIIIFETDDPRAVREAFEREWNAHRDSVQEADIALQKLKLNQREAAFKAAFGEDA